MEARSPLHPSPGSPFPCIQGMEGVCVYLLLLTHFWSLRGGQ